MRETSVERYLCRRVKEDLNGKAYKWVSPGANGVPDRIVLLPNSRLCFIETKAPGEKLRVLQEWRCEQIRALGFVVLRIDTKEKVDTFISEVKRNGV